MGQALIDVAEGVQHVSHIGRVHRLKAPADGFSFRKSACPFHFPCEELDAGDESAVDPNDGAGNVSAPHWPGT